VGVKQRDNARAGRSRRSALDQLDAIFEHVGARVSVQATARERAFRQARDELERGAKGTRLTGLVLLRYATDLLVAHAVEFAASQAELRALIKQIEAADLLPRIPLAQAVLRAPELLQLPTAVAIEVELGLLRAFMDATAVSLWAVRAEGEIKHVAHAGSFDASRRETRRLAKSLLTAKETRERPRGLTGIPIELSGRPAAALVARGATAATASRRTMLTFAAPMLAPMFEREQLFAQTDESAEAIVASAERRLARLRFDLHDGPQQDVVLLAEDLHLFGSQLERLMDGNPDRARVLGRLEDLQARLVAIDGDLRRISAFVESPFLRSDSVPEALAKLADDFTARAAIEPELYVEGDFTPLTDSQQITLIGLIREALSNVREHSEAKHVKVTVSAGADGVEATITDDGRGFDPETTLVEAARAGHLGLVGMHERVYMLGGNTLIESRPGGPTVISVKLPPFRNPE
jgi:signal transduction histidine kinase